MAKAAVSVEINDLTKIDKAYHELQEASNKLPIQTKLIEKYVKEKSATALAMQDALNKIPEAEVSIKATNSICFIYGMMRELSHYDDLISKYKLVTQMIN